MFSNHKNASIVLPGCFIALLGAFSMRVSCATTEAAVSAKIDAVMSGIPPDANTGLSDIDLWPVPAAEGISVIPTDRLYDWGTYCGIPGGIPNRSTVYTTLPSSATASQIQNAVANCPANQVVQLAAGTYNIGTITIASANQVTLRGAGAGQTVINGGIRPVGGSIGATADSWPNPRAISSGYTKGSMSITLATAPPAAFALGSLICITQNDDYDLVWHRAGNWAGTKNLRFVSRITSVNGNVIGLATPIPYSYSAALNPICTATTTTVRLFGIEGLTVNGSMPILMEGTDRCWVKEVEVTGFDNDGIRFQYGNSQCEVRRCYIHDAAGFPSSDGYFILLQYGNSCHRIEDNIAYRTAHMIFNSASACFTGYNYAYDQRRTSHAWVEVAFDSNHGPHSIMNLWEGNVGQRYQNDGYHGSGSHQTLFRNHFHGVSAVGYTQERQLVDLSRGSYYESVVGNVLGDPSWTPYQYRTVGSADHNLGYVYVLGWGTPDSGSPTYAESWTNWTGALPDAKVESTLFCHANYDYYNRAPVYQSDVSQVIPPSLCYTSKPAYFGSLQWPPIGPDVTGLVTRIPAQTRWAAYQSSSQIADLFR